MSEARKCDLCGAVHERTAGVISLDVHVATDGETDTGWNDVDLCPTCSGRVMTIIIPALYDFPNIQYPGPAKNRQYETMTRVQLRGYTVRVWTTVPEFTMGPDERVIAALSIPEQLRTVPPQEIAATLDCLDNIAAYEILDKHGDGGIVYPDWK